MKHRKELLKDIKEAKDRLKQYDDFFDSLKVGLTIFEELAYDSSPVEVISWDREKGTVCCEYSEGGDMVKSDIEYFRLSLEPTAIW